MFRAFFLVCCLAVSALSREFDPRRDGFSFANETVLAYGIDESGRLQMGRKDKDQAAAFAHRCIAMARGTLQFWKFAGFEPSSPKLSSEEYRQRLRKLFRIAVWRNARDAKHRITFPGYRDLWSFSQAHQHLIQEEIGNWLPTYLRVGNWRMPCPITRWFQGPIARATARAIRKEPQALFLAKFPSMNHAVIAYAAETFPDGRIRYRLYDPNYPGQTARLDYLPDRQLFDFEPRFYWPGGVVRAFRIYLSPIH